MTASVTPCRYHRVAALLFAAFVLRVLAQLVQAFYPQGWLPSFDQWHSGALPYPALVAAQLAIIAFCAAELRRMRHGALGASRLRGHVYLSLGAAYLAVMLFRLVAGLTFAAGHTWLDASIPTVFHLVLAAFVLTAGFFHAGKLRACVAVAAYPAMMTAGVVTHLVCVYRGLPLVPATFGPILIGCVLITCLERLQPSRVQWLAGFEDVANDSAYMLLVQIALPRLLAFVIVLALAGGSDETGAILPGLWPHAWPVPVQAVLMMLTADFLRYWLHRVSHHWDPLWRLHAVHHSPHKLYWINVGRFHPIEKSIQYVLDTLPFILVGVSQEVLALYFVFYALNGFFQHCNIDVRLGWLNYVVSGPELHRWHHARVPEISNHNYGNNLIVWDTLFGTRYLPEDEAVTDLGLLNRRYPLGFASQMLTPFVKGLDKAT